MGHDQERELLRDIGRRIGEVRRKSNQTQAQFALALGVGVKFVQRLESGQENPTLRALARIAQVLDVPARSLFQPPKTRQARIGRPPKQ